MFGKNQTCRHNKGAALPHQPHFWEFIGTCAGLLLLAIPQYASAANINLQWNPAQGDNRVAGYEVHYGPNSGQYASMVDVNGASTSNRTVSSLTEGQTYYFAIRSRSSDRTLLSAFSNELSATIPSQPSNQAPSVSLSSPTAGDTLTAGSTISLVASTNDGDGSITQVEFFANGNSVGRDTSSSNGWGLAWAGISAGNYSLTAVATDNDNAQSTSNAVAVTVTSTGTTGALPWAEPFNLNNGVTSDSGATGWSVNTSACQSPFTFSVQNNRFLASDTDGECVWTSAQVDISQAGTVAVSVDIDDGDNNKESADYLRVYYRLNGGSEVSLGQRTGNISAATLNVAGLSGNSLQVVVKTRLSYSNEYYYWDNVSIVGTGGGSPGPLPNDAPTANAGADQAITLPNNASLNGTVSDDGLPTPPAAITTTWSKFSGPGTVTFGNASDVDTTASFSISGSYVLRLRADDGDLNDTDTVTINVVAPAPSNQAPVITSMNTTPSMITDAQTSQLSVTADDPDGGPSALAYEWRIESGGGSLDNPAVATPVYTPEYVADSQQVTLRVTVSDGTDSDSETATITVESSGDETIAGLVAAFGFEETAGTATLDASGNGNDGLIKGATRINSGYFGNAMSFNGVDDWITVDDHTTLDLTDGMTLEAWIYPTTTLNGWRTVIMKEQTGNLAYHLLASTDRDEPAFNLLIDSERRLYGGSQLPANAWTHLAATYNGSKQRLYVNGVEVANRSQTGTIQKSGKVLRIGGNSIWQDEFFKGHIDEIRIYDRALTATEIQTDMLTPVVTGRGRGSQHETALVETGEIQLDHRWKRISFANTFIDPVVVASSVSSNDTDPAIVRIRNVNDQGFDIRLQEWDYQNGIHGFETVGYLVVESGSHTLPDGTQIEAGRVETNATYFRFTPFDQPSAANVTPVVFTAVTTFNDAAPVVTQMRAIGNDGFDVRIREQEANSQSHASETVSYVAWEPSSGTIDGINFEVNQTTDTVTDKAHTIQYQGTFETPPTLLANIQTTDGGDTFNLRWHNKTSTGVAVWVDEEQSGDNEITHTTETVGYAVFQQ